MKIWNAVLLVFALGLAGIALSGCPLLMIGSLGYTGYQYHEKEGVFAPGQVFGGPAPEDKDKKPSAQGSAAKAPPPNDDSIE